jgi:hypothetical protein
MILFALPPTITDNAEKSQRGERKIYNAPVQRPRRPLAQLLSRPGADGTLRLAGNRVGSQQKQQEEKYYAELLHDRRLQPKDTKKTSSDLLRPS